MYVCMYVRTYVRMYISMYVHMTHLTHTHLGGLVSGDIMWNFAPAMSPLMVATKGPLLVDWVDVRHTEG